MLQSSDFGVLVAPKVERCLIVEHDAIPLLVVMQGIQTNVHPVRPPSKVVSVVQFEHSEMLRDVPVEMGHRFRDAWNVPLRQLYVELLHLVGKLLPDVGIEDPAHHNSFVGFHQMVGSCGDVYPSEPFQQVGHDLFSSTGVSIN